MDNVKCCHDHCMFERKYGDGSFARGFMANSSKVEAKALNVGCAVNFGCPSVNEQDCSLYHTGGIVGLGRGKLSVLSQLVEKKKFSFCLPGDPKVTSKIKFGDQAAGQVKFIEADSSKYYVNLKNIQFENDLQEKPVDVDDSLLIDSGSAFSRLPKKAFRELEKRVTNLMGKKPKGSPANEGFTCYEYDDMKLLPRVMPKMVLQFDGGAKMSLPVESYLTLDSSELCLTIKPGRLTLGNFQMRNISMLFDLTKSPRTLAFWLDDCKSHDAEALPELSN
jgi:hypothetical protein